ncbi:PTS sugar transporter subunit IIB [Vibrio sonorensis]|uniref:PTS sugar transporter subunit IIB n=1 Tax=Vibrio sonorensis TaxID=1004316 RepID=UPI0008D8D93A|nr:PTS sugar transporter subunit IIB [Vibrio sonorensis]
MKIFLCCAAGMSTSMLVSKMEAAAQAKSIDCAISAHSVAEFEDQLEKSDVCLVAPQVKFRFEEFRKEAEKRGKACGLIDMQNYGMLKGDVVLQQAIELYKQSEAKGAAV